MRIANFCQPEEIKRIMHDIGVDPYGIRIMLPKATNLLIRLSGISNISANILKQEMLSLGADVAIARGALTGKVKKTDCLIIGQLTQFKSLVHKLKLQPFGLDKIALEIDSGIKNYSKNNFNLSLARGSLNLADKTNIMGIINMTPDSFSGDGLLAVKSSDCLSLALRCAQEMVSQGADIIDIGGQSSRPGAKNISIKEELRRTIPVVKLLSKKIKTPLSIDTTKTEVAQAALEEGAQIVNDICGLRNRKMAKLVAKYKAAVVIMHMLGKPANMQKLIAYRSLIDDIASYLKNAVDSAHDAGIKPEKIVIDPGLGFGKKPEHNLEIVNRLGDLKFLGKPILLGPSKKSFIAKVLGEDFKSRSVGSLAVSLLAAQQGANILRVHDVKTTFQTLKMFYAVKNCHA